MLLPDEMGTPELKPIKKVFVPAAEQLSPKIFSDPKIRCLGDFGRFIVPRLGLVENVSACQLDVFHIVGGGNAHTMAPWKDFYMKHLTEWHHFVRLLSNQLNGEDGPLLTNGSISRFIISVPTIEIMVGMRFVDRKIWTIEHEYPDSAHTVRQWEHLYFT